MDNKYEDFVGSQPCKFRIGPELTSFFVHAALLEKHSQTLAATVTGKWRAQEKPPELKDIEEATFIRFIQFTYTGDYDVAARDIVLSSQDVTTLHQAPHEVSSVKAPRNLYELLDCGANEPVSHTTVDPLESDAWPGPKKGKAKKRYVKKKNKRDALWQSFKASATVKSIQPWQPRANAEDACEDYTPVFLCHAKAYVFSDRYSIPALCELTLQKLRLTLSRFTLHDQRVGDIVELLKYTYEGETTMDHDDKIDKLRDLITDYAVCHFEKIAKHKDFQRLLQGCGDLAKDLLPKLVKRM